MTHPQAAGLVIRPFQKVVEDNIFVSETKAHYEPFNCTLEILFITYVLTFHLRHSLELRVVLVIFFFPHNLQRSNTDAKFAEQFLERVYAVVHAANDDSVYVEFVRLLNDFGEKEKTSDSVTQVPRSISLKHETCTALCCCGTCM